MLDIGYKLQGGRTTYRLPPWSNSGPVPQDSWWSSCSHWGCWLYMSSIVIRMLCRDSEYCQIWFKMLQFSLFYTFSWKHQTQITTDNLQSECEHTFKRKNTELQIWTLIPSKKWKNKSISYTAEDVLQIAFIFSDPCLK